MKNHISKYVIILIISLIHYQDSLSQKNEDYKVGILLYNGVELLDFSGPGEVFGATQGFDVYTVSVDGSEILSQGFVTVKPEYSIETAPLPDILVLPGGGTGTISKDQHALAWINEIADQGGINMSVCTGANILAKAGLLEGLNVTTWHGFTKRLQEYLPNSRVLENTRFVDSGNIITTAGVSAGIDGALHMVSRIKGYDIAKATARYMEYDKWVPEDGKVDYKSDLQEQYNLISQNDKSGVLHDLSLFRTNGNPAFYEGEMKNLAVEFEGKGKIKDATALLELTIKAYPNSLTSYAMLSVLYKKQGMFAPPSQNEFIQMLKDGKIDEAKTVYKEVQQKHPGWKIFSEGYVNYIGYQYMKNEEFDTAIAVFKLNAEAYPDSANVYDSLGEAYLKSGNKELAQKYYQKALEIDPQLATSKKALNDLETD